MGHDLLSRFKSSVVLGDKRQSRLLGTNGSRPEQRCQQQALAAGSFGRLRIATLAARRLLLVEGLKERLVWLKTRFFQILGHVILGLVVHRHFVMFAALF